MPGQLGKVLTVTRSASLAAALDNVRKGSYDAAVQQQGTTLVVHYSIAYQTMAAAGHPDLPAGVPLGRCVARVG